MTERKPAEVFDPREFCREEMAERGMAEAMLPITVTRWLRDADAPLSGPVAFGLSALFGTSRELWRNLETAWQNGRER
jgi:plasmid maintenance system antidote protein VapI